MARFILNVTEHISGIQFLPNLACFMLSSWFNKLKSLLEMERVAIVQNLKELSNVSEGL